MIRRHLALSIALATVLSLLAGGLAYAALGPDVRLTACVTSDGAVRAASTSSRCPYRTTAVEIASQADLEEVALKVRELSTPPRPPKKFTKQVTIGPNSTDGAELQCPAGEYIIDHSHDLELAVNATVLRARTYDFAISGYPNAFRGSARNNQSAGNVLLNMQIFCAPVPD